jgi:hypothetical protein
MRLKILTAVAVFAMWLARQGQGLGEAAEALEVRMDAWRERWGYTADEVYGPFYQRATLGSEEARR